MNQNPSVNVAQKAVSTPQVSEQLAILEQEIEDNAKIIANIATRLSGILQQCPQDSCATQAPEVMLVQHADHIRTLFKAERANNIELRRILNAIEL